MEAVVKDINHNLDAGVDLLEGLLVKKAGLVDAMGLVEGLYPGAAAAGLRNFPDSTEVRPPRISEVYTKGTLTLARLGREAPIAAASPNGPVLRNVEGGSLDARLLYPENRQSRPERLDGHPSSAPARPCSTRRASSAAARTPGDAEIARRARGPRPPPRGSSRRSSGDRTHRARCWRTDPEPVHAPADPRGRDRSSLRGDEPPTCQERPPSGTPSR